MPTPAVPALTLLPDLPSGVGGRDFSADPQAAVTVALAQLHHVLADFLMESGEAEKWTHLLETRREAGALIARLSRKMTDSLLVHDVLELVREMAKSGVHDHPVDANDLAQAQRLARKGWPGLLAAMLLVPAWQWPAAPLVMEVPAWLRADYVRWLFTAPQVLTVPGHSENYAAHTLGRLEELQRWVKRGPGATEELKVLGAYASHCSLLAAGAGTENLRRHAELRGQILQRVMGAREDTYRVAPRPRAGRRLRIGIMVRQFDADPEVYMTLPLFEKLDPERFEIFLFTYVSNFGRLEEYCRQISASLTVLPGKIEDQLTLLREWALDIVLFGTDVTAKCNVVTRLALHRVAPLQVVHGVTGSTSGLPEIDLYLTGSLAGAGVAAQFSERLGLLPGATHAFNFEADREEMQSLCVRSDFGLPDDATVFVSTANFRKITPEVQQRWAKILAAVPGAYLLLHPFHAEQVPAHAITHFYATLEAKLQSEGVDPARLVVSTVAFASRTDVQGLVALGDVYLDSFPVSDVQTLVEPLTLHLPVVTGEGTMLRSRTGASLLRALEMDDLIPQSEVEYQALAVKLATDDLFRERCVVRIREKMASTPGFLDSTATSRAFGALLEAAWDELVARGHAGFRAQGQPIVVG